MVTDRGRGYLAIEPSSALNCWSGPFASASLSAKQLRSIIVLILGALIAELFILDANQARRCSHRYPCISPCCAGANEVVHHRLAQQVRRQQALRQDEIVEALDVELGAESLLGGFTNFE